MLRYILIILLGALTHLSFPPFGYTPIIVISYVLLLWSITQSKNIKQAWGLGFLFALSHNLFGLYWLYSISDDYDNIDQIAISAIISIIFGLLSLWFSLFSALLKYFYKRTWHYYIFALPSLLTVYEWSKSWFLTGFPWYAPADALESLGVYALLPVMGYLGICFLFYFCISIVVFIINNPTKKLGYFLIACFSIALYSAILLSQTISWTSDLPTLKTRVITGNFDLNMKNSRYETIKRFDTYKQLSLQYPPADIVLWPESSISVNYHSISEHIDRNNTHNIYAGVYYDDKKTTYNTLFHFAENAPVYYKKHFIPFAEYTPKWLALLKEYLPSFNMDELSSKSNTHFTHNNTTLFASICFELLFSTELLEASKQANLHLHSSDLGWFDNTIATTYLLNIARMRARETSKPILYSVNKGVSAIIDHKGNILTRQLKDGTFVLNQEVIPQQGTTFYATYQNLPLFVFISIMLAIFGLYFYNASKNKD